MFFTEPCVLELKNAISSSADEQMHCHCQLKVLAKITLVEWLRLAGWDCGALGPASYSAFIVRIQVLTIYIANLKSLREPNKGGSQEICPIKICV